jgi:UDP-N-acetylmuramoylalanine--D-glutamate ligase
VAEVSSFQLETVDRFCPRIAVLMNIYPNHLDRHASFQEYLRAKARLFAHMGPRDTAVVYAPDAGRVRRMVSRITGVRRAGYRTVTFGVEAGVDYRYEKGGVRYDAGRQWVSVEGSRFDNPVLGLTAAAAAAVMDACHVPMGGLPEVMRSFVPLPHRMTEVATLRGVRFVNDSKATTLTAMAAGVGMTDGPVRLIAGGLLKEHQLASVNNVLARNVRGAYLIGKAAEKMNRAWGAVVPCTVSGTLEAAVKDAWREAQAGETVLLSPACASFDQFRNFEDRGEQFCRQVLALKDREGL